MEKLYILEACFKVYGKAFRDHMYLKREMAPIWSLGRAYSKWFERRYQHMLEFKNAKGEIVMTEKDNGELNIHDEVLKESLENKLSLEEAAEKQSEQENK
jgi:hypothetical protein